MAIVINKSDRLINGTEVKITDLRNKYCGCHGVVRGSTSKTYIVYLHYHGKTITVSKDYVRLNGGK